jgi:hypothetical protein
MDLESGSREGKRNFGVGYVEQYYRVMSFHHIAKFYRKFIRNFNGVYMPIIKIMYGEMHILVNKSTILQL